MFNIIEYNDHNFKENVKLLFKSDNNLLQVKNIYLSKVLDYLMGIAIITPSNLIKVCNNAIVTINIKIHNSNYYVILY